MIEMNSFSCREITPHYESDDQWNDVTINAGASQSTLQDIKLPESAGHFSYHHSRDFASSCRNRFIYWRTNNDVVQLVEISLDTTLRCNRLKLRFQNTPILQGVSIHEYLTHVVLLVPTVSAIHKIVFPHPRSIECELGNNDLGITPSVFFNTTSDTIRRRTSSFVLNHVSLGLPVPHTSASWLHADGTAAFVLADGTGSVLLVCMSDHNGVEISSTELAKTGSLLRYVTGFVPSAIRGGNKIETALGIVCHQTPTDTLVCVLFNDLQIKIWSSKRQELILSETVFNFDPDKKLNGRNFTAHQCHLRKSESCNSNEFLIGVYVPVSNQKVFYILKAIYQQNQFKIGLVSVLQQTSHDLVDFSLNEHQIWTLWLSSDNQPLVLTAQLEPVQRTLNSSWMPVDLEPRVSRNVDYSTSNPQQAYLQEIFKVGRFTPTTIQKALSIYNVSKNSSFSNKKLEDIRNWVIEAVETEILMKSGDDENSENDYLNISADCWDRFLSYCIQYHEVGMKPLGIGVIQNVGGVILIKKSLYSLLCLCDSLEVVINPRFQLSLLSTFPGQDENSSRSLQAVLECVEMVKNSIDPKLLIRMDYKLLNQQCPINYATQLCKSNFEVDELLPSRLKSLLPPNDEIVTCLSYLLSILDLTDGDMVRISTSSELGLPKYPSFASGLSGVSALCAGLKQFARQRYEFCLKLLLFELVLYESDVMDCEEMDDLLLQSGIVPRTVSLLRPYFVIWWCTQCEYNPVSLMVQDAAFKQFCLLELPELTNQDLTSPKERQTICQLFLEGKGGSKARIIMESRLESSSDCFETLYPHLILSTSSLLWPQESNTVFPEFLFSQCQHTALLEYDKLMQGWCTGNKQFLDFLVASSYLILGDASKACKMFMEVSKNIERESVLCQKVLTGRYNFDSGVSDVSLFCMRVIQMFELASQSECVVKLASAVLNEISNEDPHVPIFYSILFKHHLNLDHYDQAFATLVKNPDSSRKKDCLRQLIVKLCEVKQFQKIIEQSYLDFEEEVVGILESRARCSDLCQNASFYGILYSLHMHHKKFRKAASVMYELAMRYGKEVLSLKGLKKQVSCYLAAINCLHLSEPEYAWIVKPSSDMKDSESYDPKSSPKRNSEGDEIIHSTRPVKVEVLGLEDVQREYALARSRLLHARAFMGSPGVVTPLTAEETVALLTNASLFDAAVKLSKCYSLSLAPVLEALVYKCLTIPTKTGSSLGTSQFWHLLHQYIKDHEAKGSTLLHRCVSEKLLIHGAEIPAWLRLSYQKRNFTELATLFIQYGLIDSAIVLIHKYVKAVLGERKEDFELDFSLHVNSPPVWLPHTLIDILVDIGEKLHGDEHIRELFEGLMDTLDKYAETVESISNDKMSRVC